MVNVNIIVSINFLYSIYNTYISIYTIMYKGMKTVKNWTAGFSAVQFAFKVSSCL